MYESFSRMSHDHHDDDDDYYDDDDDPDWIPVRYDAKIGLIYFMRVPKMYGSYGGNRRKPEKKKRNTENK